MGGKHYLVDNSWYRPLLVVLTRFRVAKEQSKNSFAYAIIGARL